MKTLLTSLIIAACLFSSCKKESSKIPGDGTWLLEKANYDGNNGKATDSYTYDDKKRVVSMQSAISNENYEYIYDDYNNVTTVSTYGKSKRLLTVDRYFYTDDKIIVEKYSANGTSLVSNITFRLNADKQIINQVNSRNSIDYTYDGNGNMVKLSIKTLNGVLIDTVAFSYDDKRSPLSTAVGRNPHLMFLTTNSMYSNKHNMLKSSAMGSAYAMQYLANGLPQSAFSKTQATGVWGRVEYQYKINN